MALVPAAGEPVEQGEQTAQAEPEGVERPRERPPEGRLWHRA